MLGPHRTGTRRRRRRARLAGFIVAAMAAAPAWSADRRGDVPSAGAAANADVFGADAFSRPLPALGPDERGLFFAGRELFRRQWRPQSFSGTTANAVGLGPFYNHRSCAGCHVRDGRGRPPPANARGPARGMVLRLGVSASAGVRPHAVLGRQLQDQAVPGVAREGRIRLDYKPRAGIFDDGTEYTLREPIYTIEGTDAAVDELLISPRVPPALIGLGLLEAVALDAAMADPEDKDGDGISGRLALVDGEIGRFGWKATRAGLRDQVVAAAADDLGLASRYRPDGGCSPIQARLISTCAVGLEIDEAAIDGLVGYLRRLAPPPRRFAHDPIVRRGRDLFSAAGCGACHRPSLRLGARPPLPHLAGQTIRPFTDMLLHDMGDGLADALSEGAASGREWRTPPLWGIGLVAAVNGHSLFLHDGRARSLMEAVLWHGGEAAGAAKTVLGWSARDRQALIAFLESL